MTHTPKITDAMIEAGKGAWLDKRGFSDADILSAIYLAMQASQPADDVVERAGEAAYYASCEFADDGERLLPGWKALDDTTRDCYRSIASAAIAALQPSQDGEAMRDAATIKCALALFDSLAKRGNRYAAVKVDGPLNWTITEPRTPEALLAALETE